MRIFIYDFVWTDTSNEKTVPEYRYTQERGFLISNHPTSAHATKCFVTFRPSLTSTAERSISIKCILEIVQSPKHLTAYPDGVVILISGMFVVKFDFGEQEFSPPAPSSFENSYCKFM